MKKYLAVLSMLVMVFGTISMASAINPGKLIDQGTKIMGENNGIKIDYKTYYLKPTIKKPNTDFLHIEMSIYSKPTIISRKNLWTKTNFKTTDITGNFDGTVWNENIHSYTYDTKGNLLTQDKYTATSKGNSEAYYNEKINDLIVP